MLLGFQQRFEKKILAKQKRHTIRAKRKLPPRVGETCHCYVNPRRKTMRLLGRWPCVKVQDIHIKARKYAYLGHIVWIRIDGVLLDADESQALALSDGFDSLVEMVNFWSGRLPFHGDMIHWDPDRPHPGPNKKKGRKRK